MREIVTILGRRYSAVSSHDNQCDINAYQSRKSLRSSRTLSRGLSIVDSFFNKRESGKRTRSPKGIFLLLTTGIISICLAILLFIYKPYDLIFKWKLVFSPQGEIYELWAKPPVELYIKIYLFNVTNAEEFLAGNASKIRVNEVGPYVYRELLSHENITFNHNGTISVSPYNPLVWQDHLSEGHTEDDILMLPNIALLSIAQVAAEKSFLVRAPINMVIRQTDSKPIVKMTAKEFMFGYESTLTTLGHTFLPDWINFEKVGLIDRMYDFAGDFETIYTGEEDVRYAGLFDTFRGSRNLPQWKGDHCSNIHHTSDGTKFQSFIQPNDTVKLFRKSLCRAQQMIRTNTEHSITGITGQKYVFPPNALDNGAVDERNKCFCRNGNCMPPGLLDVADCYYGFPIALSYPHYLDADSKIREKIDGTSPDPELHGSYFMLEEVSGLPLQCHMRFQINFFFRDLNSMENVEKFSNLVMPMLWFDITMEELPKSLQNRFYFYLTVGPFAEKLMRWVGFLGGVLCLLVAVSKAIKKLFPQDDSKSAYLLRNHIRNRSSSVYKSTTEQKKAEAEKMACISIQDKFNTVDMDDDSNKNIMDIDEEDTTEDSYLTIVSTDPLDAVDADDEEKEEDEDNSETSSEDIISSSVDDISPICYLLPNKESDKSIVKQYTH